MEKFKYLAKNKISELPKTPGVYAFLARRSFSKGGKKGRKFLYIGKAISLLNRVKQHRELLDSVEQIAYIETDSENEALLLEAKLIKQFQPKYNIDWKDDKNYFYVGVTNEQFPRVFITHQIDEKAKYMGPFVDGKKIKQMLRELRKIHPYRTCKTLPQKPCLWYHLKQCPAPCLPAEVSRRETKEGLFPGRHIEAYDISNIQGHEATGSMVTFVNGKPDKNFYRRFKIKGEAKSNDVAMLKEVLSRRLKHREWPYPDLMLIDGGKAQFNAALKVKNQNPKFKNTSQNPKVVALAKRNNELYVEEEKNPILLKNLPQEFANLILRARDEAHRFARAYHHKLRDKALLQ